MEQWHVTLSSTHRKTLFPLEHMLRAAVLVIDRVVGDVVLLFCVTDNHVHVWMLVAGDRVRYIGGLLRRSLRRVTEVPIDVVDCRPVATRGHELNMVDYLLGQLGHHGIDAFPPRWAGCCYQDLIGARRLDGFRPRIRQYLPRLHRADLDRVVGIEPDSLGEAAPADVRRAGPEAVVDAAARALAVGPELLGRPRRVTTARRAACHVATEARIRQIDIAQALALPPRTVRRLVSEPVAPELLSATRLQIAIAQLPPAVRLVG